MKKIILLSVVLCCIHFLSKAQEFEFQKGDFLLEGSLSAQSNTGGMDNYNKQSSFSFQPQLGYFIANKWAVGVFGGFGNEKFENKPEASSIRLGYKTSFVGAFGRYYFLNLGKRFKTFASLETRFQTTSPDNLTAAYDLPKRKQYGANTGIGANFFLTKNITIAYTFTDVMGLYSYRDVGSDPTNVFYMNLNSFNNIFSAGAFSLGFRF